MQAALKKIEAVFQPGTLGARRDEMAQLQASGDTMLFDGSVHWSVTLTDADKKVKGEAPSLDEAFSSMIACLDFLAADYGEDTEVICHVSLAD